jgi:hypothetical protein
MVGQGSPGLPVLRDTRDATALSVMQGNTMAAKAWKGSSQNYCGELGLACDGRSWPLETVRVDLRPEKAGSHRRRQS